MRIGILGHGIVGSGVAEILIKNADVVAKSAGRGIVLERILEIRDLSGLSYRKLLTKEPADVLENPNVDIVVECMGGIEPAFAFAMRAIQSGKHFVTSNKALIASRGEELLTAAREHNVQLLYEGSVGGGIPVLHAIHHSLGANRLQKVTGILNGTTNFILTRMRDGGAGFDTALAEAQALGYAEADPSADVDGVDARRKICILAHAAYGAVLDDEKIPTVGIRNLHRDDMLYAMELGRSIKLLAVARSHADGWTARVWPTMVPSSHPLAHVSDVFNAVAITGDQVDEVLFYGRGAGKEATASAVVGDIISIAKNTPPTDRQPSDLKYLPDNDGLSRFFVRATGSQADAEQVERILPGALILQPSNAALAGSFAIITAEGPASSLLQKIDSLPIQTGECIRYEGA